ncbi:MAG: nucleoside hydrolase [Myxococcales bacterium]|nr:nucleoside hydrolase [Myxococcales bacterium]
MATRVLFDTDIGSDVDDAVALGLILACPDVLELVAVTTVAGDTGLRSEIAARMLGVGGRADVPVFSGRTRPRLRGQDRYSWFGHEDAMVPEGTASATIHEELAHEAIVRISQDVSDLHVVAVGPLTNLARAVALDPTLPERIAGLWVMGGHIRRVAIGKHVCAPGIDYNLCSDPEASCAVLGAGFRTTLVSADVTLQTWLRDADVERMAAGGALGRLIAHQIGLWKPVQHQLFTSIGGDLEPANAAYLHDPLTVQALIDPSALKLETLRIVTTIEGGTLRTHEVDPALGIGMETRVATEVDAAAAERAIVERLVTL